MPNRFELRTAVNAVCVRDYIVCVHALFFFFFFFFPLGASV